MGGTWQAKAGVGPMKGGGCHNKKAPFEAVLLAKTSYNFIFFFNLGFGKILATKKFRQHNGYILDNSKSCIHPIYTISKYMATSIPSHAYNTKLCPYISSIIHNQSLFLT